MTTGTAQASAETASCVPCERRDGHDMQCMEVWGGNEAADSAVAMPGLDAWVFSKPYKGAVGGGDVHYVSSCATGRITRLLVADVSGHGAEVSDIAVTLRTLMRRYVNYPDQRRFVMALNREFQGAAEGGMFATAVVASFWAPTGQLVISNAGHPRPLAFSARTGQWRAIDVQDGRVSLGLSNLPLGILDDIRYDVVGAKLSEGDVVMFYTDSLLEARDAGGRFLGQDGLLRIVADLDPSDPGAFVKGLLLRIAEGQGHEVDDDDATVLVLRASGLGVPRMTARQHAETAGRFLRMVGERLKDSRRPIPWPQFSVANIGGAIIPVLNRLRLW